ncbi:transposase [Salinispora mooreana]|uniref:transposase n=1 Tax=Salinispora mooreana TaxID=999545 RepID=UPI0021DF58AF|nr:transposase [Salinispora mooreana]
MIADGGEAIADIDVVRHQADVFGRVASPATCWRALDEVDPMRVRRIARARAKVRTRVWSLFDRLPAARAAGRDVGAGVVVLDVDATLLAAHNEKEGADKTYKRTFGVPSSPRHLRQHREILAIQLRPDNAGANTTADHLHVLTEASAQVPAKYRRNLLVRADSAGATHDVLDWLHVQNAKRGRTVETGTRKKWQRRHSKMLNSTRTRPPQVDHLG